MSHQPFPLFILLYLPPLMKTSIVNNIKFLLDSKKKVALKYFHFKLIFQFQERARTGAEIEMSRL